MEKTQIFTFTDSTDNLPWGKIGEIGLAMADFQQGEEVFHRHTFFEMVLVRSGSGIHVTEDYRAKIHRGDIFLIKPGCGHTYEDAQNLVITNILFLPGKLGIPMFDLCDTFGYYAFFEAHPRVSGPCRERYTLRLNNNQLRIAEEIIVEIEEEQKRMPAGHEFYRKLAFMRLIGLICRAVTESEEHDIGELNALGKIIRYFEKNYPSRIQVEDLTPLCGKSASAITRLFRRAMGRSPIDYLIGLRLEKAAALLRESSTLSIGEIAVSCGFQDSNYFCKMFHRRFNRSPRIYRKEESDDQARRTGTAVNEARNPPIFSA